MTLSIIITSIAMLSKTAFVMKAVKDTQRDNLYNDTQHNDTLTLA
jgi:hypothetical protein